MTEPKLYLWVWSPALRDYTAGVMFALAATADEARALILKDCDYIPSAELAVEPTRYDAPVGFAVWGGG